MDNYNDLTGMFSLSKTLRFELKPIGRTLENIKRKGLLSQEIKGKIKKHPTESEMLCFCPRKT